MTAEIVLVAEGGEEAGRAVDAAVAVLDAEDAWEGLGARHAGDDLGLVAFDVEDHQVDVRDLLFGDEVAVGERVDRELLELAAFLAKYFEVLGGVAERAVAEVLAALGVDGLGEVGGAAGVGEGELEVATRGAVLLEEAEVPGGGLDVDAAPAEGFLEELAGGFDQAVEGAGLDEEAVAVVLEVAFEEDLVDRRVPLAVEAHGWCLALRG